MLIPYMVYTSGPACLEIWIWTNYVTHSARPVYILFGVREVSE